MKYMYIKTTKYIKHLELQQNKTEKNVKFPNCHIFSIFFYLSCICDFSLNSKNKLYHLLTSKVLHVFFIYVFLQANNNEFEHTFNKNYKVINQYRHILCTFNINQDISPTYKHSGAEVYCTFSGNLYI